MTAVAALLLALIGTDRFRDPPSRAPQPPGEPFLRPDARSARPPTTLHARRASRSTRSIAGGPRGAGAQSVAA